MPGASLCAFTITLHYRSCSPLGVEPVLKSYKYYERYHNSLRGKMFGRLIHPCQVVDNVLRDREVSDQVLVNRAKV